MKKRQTLADVARAAGVSMMTVSRAINNKPGLSDELRQKILTLADEMGFQPNYMARSLVNGQTFTIGLVVPDITNMIFAHLARGVTDSAYERGYSVFLINTGDDPAREQAGIQLLRQKEIDGAILCSSRLPIDQLETIAQGFPAVIVINREFKILPPNIVTINVNDYRAAQIAVQHFIDSGRTRIAFAAGPANNFSTQRRLEGYRQALKNADIAFDPQMIENCALTTEGGREAGLALLQRNPDIDAVFCLNDVIAAGVMQIFQENGKSVPDQVGIIGVDDIPLATILRPQMSTVRFNLTHIGKLSMRTLLEMASGEGAPANYQIEPELIIRESS